MKLHQFKELIDRLIPEHGDLEVMNFIPDPVGVGRYTHGTTIGIAHVDRLGVEIPERAPGARKVIGIA